MKRNEQRFQRFFNRAFEPFLSVPQQQVDADCERVLNRLRDEPDGPLESATDDVDSVRRSRAWFRPVLAFSSAAVTILVVLQLLSIWNGTSATDAHAVVEAEDGGLYRVSGKQALHAGDRIEAGEAVRTNGGVGTVLKLADGSSIEMRSGSELTLERADDGLRIRLARGGALVNAAKQRQGHLYVQTKDVTVQVVGTVFLVSAEKEGSRVAVIQGEVDVRRGAVRQQLLPGEQVATDPAMPLSPVSQEIAWSRNAEMHLALLQQSVVLTGFQKPAGERVAFELVSIRPRDPVAAAGGRGGGPSVECANTFQSDPQRFMIRNANVYTLIAMAYVPGSCLMARQLDLISGGPGWVRSERFDIEALLPAGSTTYTPAQLFQGRGAEKLQMMLRTMLAERFGLVLKSEVKERTGYVLTNSADESKLKPWDAGRTVKDPDTGKEQASGCGMRSIPDQDGQRVSGDINCWNVPMPSFINSLAFLISRPVLDQTNLDGMYEYNLKFAHPDYTGTFPSAFPSLPTAVREQLGLRLENSKAPVEVLVIDRVEKPSAN